ncbi:hypothetical protein JB92DRAFT_3130401 [Gautieria morchelliformis]|nr:hypothetical protein JB92DRAFT_3130401 [Gautieria morchelliformis]
MQPSESSIPSDNLNFTLDEHAPWVTNDVNHSHTANDTREDARSTLPQSFSQTSPPLVSLRVRTFLVFDSIAGRARDLNYITLTASPSLDKGDAAGKSCMFYPVALIVIIDTAYIREAHGNRRYACQLRPSIPPAVTHGHPQHIYMPVGTIAKTSELKGDITTTEVEGQTHHRCNNPSCSHQRHFDTRREAISHIRRVHLKELKPFICITCGKYFAHKQDASRHVNAKNRGKIFECPICHERYARKDYCDMHARRCLTKRKQ